MRWAGRILLALLPIWAVYFVSPYVSMYGLARAIETKDAAAIERRVNFRAVRASVARQLIPAYLAATGRESEIKGAKGQAVVGIGTSIADPVLAQYLSPVAFAEFLNDPRLGAGGGSPAGPGNLGSNSLRSLWRMYITAETRGFRAISFAVPVDKAAEERFRLQMRMRGLGWRLVGIDLPQPVLQRLVRELIRSNPAAS
jgi:Protein of unknown function (DUF2939)